MLLKFFKKSMRDTLLGLFKISFAIAVLVGTIVLASELASAASRLVSLPKSLESSLTFVLWILFIVSLSALADTYKEARKDRTRRNLLTKLLDMLLVEEVDLAVGIDSILASAKGVGTTAKPKPPKETVEDQLGEGAGSPRIDPILEARVMTTLENLRERLRWVEQNRLTQFDVVKIMFLIIGAIAAAFGIAAGALNIFSK